jgi:hypothetical protein
VKGESWKRTTESGKEEVEIGLVERRRMLIFSSYENM